MRNTLGDLNNHLFAQLERLSDEDVKGDELKQEINRSKAIMGVAKNIIDNGSLVLESQKFMDDRFNESNDLPKMLDGGKNV
ncbi:MULTISPECIES: hypothetical protein [Mammaliicoccus]|uniref:hypothetical protein n=1 Tax=Mammaliicoccus TaxID=2803850 RepID=UPI001071F729|nr:hypothetical protein [Mammaliicoccus lentus]MBF0750438.1 hypothetical protein [Mammaliicoccus lentus]TFU56486.1 hypothetical protein E4T93_13745 [Mammaliicoccus lentus]